MSSQYEQQRAALEKAKCTHCDGSGKGNDADFGDISYNEWVCPKCNGTGLKPNRRLARILSTSKRA